jgi:cytochrome c oxidase subunit 2
MSWWRLPENVSTYGGEVDQLYLVILVITGLAFVITEAALVYFLWRFRARPGEERRAIYLPGNQRLEVAWTVIPGLVLFGLAVYQYQTWSNIKIDLPEPDSAVQVMLRPEQFLWAVRYAGADGQLGTEDDIEAPNNVIHVPVNEPVLLQLEAQDVIHSFFVPVLRLKQDALPGSTVPAWFQATQTGEFEVACAELCGLGHYRMKATLVVEEREAFDAWLAEQQAAQAPSDGLEPVAAAASSGG